MRQPGIMILMDKVLWWNMDILLFYQNVFFWLKFCVYLMNIRVILVYQETKPLLQFSHFCCSILMFPTKLFVLLRTLYAYFLLQKHLRSIAHQQPWRYIFLWYFILVLYYVIICWNSHLRSCQETYNIQHVDVMCPNNAKVLARC